MKRSCTSRPDCPCVFCVQARADLEAGRTTKQEQDDLARQWIEECLDRAEDERVFGTPQRKPN